MVLEKGKKYWCGWASRYAWYIHSVSRYSTITQKREIVHKFIDVCDCIIECEDQHIEKWVKKAK